MGLFLSGGSEPTLRGHEATLHDLLSSEGRPQGMRSHTCFRPPWTWGVAGSRADHLTALKLGTPSLRMGPGFLTSRRTEGEPVWNLIYLDRSS